MVKNNIADQEKGTTLNPELLKTGEIAAAKWKNLKEKSNDNVSITISDGVCKLATPKLPNLVLSLVRLII